jgi:hypothetical protein
MVLLFALQIYNILKQNAIGAHKIPYNSLFLIENNLECTNTELITPENHKHPFPNS